MSRWQFWKLRSARQAITPLANSTNEMENVVVAVVPVSFHRNDWEQKDWSTIREQLLNTQRELMYETIADRVREKGWKRSPKK